MHAELTSGIHSLAHNGFLIDQADKVRRNAPASSLTSTHLAKTKTDGLTAILHPTASHRSYIELRSFPTTIPAVSHQDSACLYHLGFRHPTQGYRLHPILLSRSHDPGPPSLCPHPFPSLQLPLSHCPFSLPLIIPIYPCSRPEHCFPVATTKLLQFILTNHQ